MPRLTDDQFNRLVDLRANTKMTRQEIADEIGAPFWAVLRGITKIIEEQKDTAREMAKLQKKRKLHKQGEGMTLMERCKGVLGKRMTEDHRGYVLDGRPAISEQIRKAAKL
jgi:hypothetical protein